MDNNFDNKDPLLQFMDNEKYKPPVIGKAYAGERCMMTIIGELRHFSTESVFEEVITIFESGVKDLILDFRRLRYADTAGLQNLVRIYKYVEGNPGLHFSVLTQPGEIMNVLKTCRFDKFINISQDENEFTDDWLEI